MCIFVDLLGSEVYTPLLFRFRAKYCVRCRAWKVVGPSAHRRFPETSRKVAEFALHLVYQIAFEYKRTTVYYNYTDLPNGFCNQTLGGLGPGSDFNKMWDSRGVCTVSCCRIVALLRREHETTKTSTPTNYTDLPHRGPDFVKTQKIFNTMSFDFTLILIIGPTRIVIIACCVCIIRAWLEPPEHLQSTMSGPIGFYIVG